MGICDDIFFVFLWMTCMIYELAGYFFFLIYLSYPSPLLCYLRAIFLELEF